MVLIVPAIQEAMLFALMRILEERYVPNLPPLFGNQTEENKRTKQVSRAFSAFVFQKILGIDAKTAAEMVVDDFNDNGIDAIYYDSINKTLYLIQSKLQATEQFSQDEAFAFIQGVRLLV